MIIKEACIETLSQAVIAEQHGATQLEVCSHLELGGLTPSNELILEIRNAVSIPMHVMVRPTARSFVYTLREMEEMIRTIAFCKENNVDGVVFGILLENNELDLKALEELVIYAKPLYITIHKAIDETADPMNAARSLSQIEGITEILTSGGKETALEGAGVIRDMIKATKGKIRIKAAGRITYKNFIEVHNSIDAEAYHGRKIVEGL